MHACPFHRRKNRKRRHDDSAGGKGCKFRSHRAHSPLQRGLGIAACLNPLICASLQANGLRAIATLTVPGPESTVRRKQTRTAYALCPMPFKRERKK